VGGGWGVGGCGTRGESEWERFYHYGSALAKRKGDSGGGCCNKTQPTSEAGRTFEMTPEIGKRRDFTKGERRWFRNTGVPITDQGSVASWSGKPY